MWRISVMVVALVAASCTARGESPERARPDEPTAVTLPDGTEGPVASPPRDDFGPFVDVATDPFFERRSRPLLAADPKESWTITVDRVTVPFAGAVADVILVHTITADRDHALVAHSRADGGVVWKFTTDETIGLVSVVEDSVLVTLAVGEELRAVLLDGASGDEIPLPSDDNLGGRGNRIEAFTTGSCSVRHYEPTSGALVGEFCPMSAGGPETFVGRVGDSVIEVDPLDLQPVSDPIPIDKISEQRSVMVFGDTVVAYSLSALNILDRKGEIVTSLPDPGDLTLTAAGPGSDVLIVDDYGQAIGVDVRTLNPIWERPIFVAPFGVVDGEVIGATRPQTSATDEASTEVFSLDTGETKCVIGAEVDMAENGFYEPHGVAYDLGCVERWTIDAGDEAKVHVIDSGVVTAESADDGTTEIRFFS